MPARIIRRRERHRASRVCRPCVLRLGRPGRVGRPDRRGHRDDLLAGRVPPAPRGGVRVDAIPDLRSRLRQLGHLRPRLVRVGGPLGPDRRATRGRSRRRHPRRGARSVESGPHGGSALRRVRDPRGDRRQRLLRAPRRDGHALVRDAAGPGHGDHLRRHGARYLPRPAHGPRAHHGGGMASDLRAVRRARLGRRGRGDAVPGEPARGSRAPKLRRGRRAARGGLRTGA